MRNGKGFIAKKTSTKFCSLHCGQRNYKVRQRINTIGVSNAKVRSSLKQESNYSTALFFLEPELIGVKLLALTIGYNEHEGFFRWDNAQGEKMVEFIFWRSNSTDNRSKQHHSESGYGWAVLLSEQGMQLMIDALGNIPLYHYRKIYRHQWYSQKKYNTQLDGDYSVSDVEPIDPVI